MIARILNILFSSSFDTNKNKQKKPGPKKSRFFLCKCFFLLKKFFTFAPSIPKIDRFFDILARKNKR